MHRIFGAKNQLNLFKFNIANNPINPNLELLVL